MTATVRISPRLTDHLNELSRRLGDGGSAELLLRLEGDMAVAKRGLLAAVLEVQDDFAQASEATDELDPPETGEWDWTTVPAGLLIVIRDTRTLEAALDAVTVALQRRNVSGELELWKPAPARDLPFQSPMIACRLCVVGHRLADRTWNVDAAARNTTVTLADRWCRIRVPGGSPALSTGTAGWIGLDVVADLVGCIGVAADEGHRALVANVGSAGFRAFGVYADGGLVLIAGGAHIETAAWEEELAELTELLRISADHLAYGCIFRGWDIVGALGVHDLPTDWPLRPGTSTKRDRPAANAEQADDIFGVQLLGPGYPDLQVPADWQTEQVGTAVRLLSHTDPSAWFSTPFVPIGQRLPVNQRSAPPILRQARDEFAAILSPTPSI